MSELNIEIMEFYPIDRDPKKHKRFIGTLQIYLVDEDIEISGIGVFMSNSKWYFNLPSRKLLVPDPVNGATMYLNVRFRSKEKQLELMKFLNTKGIEFILEKAKTQQGVKKCS
jgi:hypothetical protein